ncbi:MAG: hypothetical protein WKF84_07345 [Pyrinomonadaceae bacterium]
MGANFSCAHLSRQRQAGSRCPLQTAPAGLEKDAGLLSALADTYRALGQSQQERATLEQLVPLAAPAEGSLALARLALSIRDGR